MPAKSGLSHGFAAFTSIILGTIISNYLSAHETIFTKIIHTTGELVIDTLGLSLSRTVAGMLLISSIIAFLWGWRTMLPAINHPDLRKTGLFGGTLDPGHHNQYTANKNTEPKKLINQCHSHRN